MQNFLSQLFPLFVKVFNTTIVARIPEKFRPILGLSLVAALYFICEKGWLGDFWGGTAIGVVAGAFGMSANSATVGAGFGLALAQATSSKKAEPGTTPFTMVASAHVLPGNAAVVVSQATSETLTKLDLVSSKPIEAAPVAAGPTVAVKPVEMDVVASKPGEPVAPGTPTPPDTLDLLLSKDSKAPDQLERLN